MRTLREIIEQISPDRKAVVVASLLGVLWIASAIVHRPDTRILGIQLLLLVHTYYSIRCFSRLIHPLTAIQILIDTLLLVFYGVVLWLPLSLTGFLGALSALCGLATIKYMNASYDGHQRQLFVRKTIVDGIATVLLVLATIASIRGFAQEAITAGVIAYVIGSIDGFLIHPLYPVRS